VADIDTTFMQQILDIPQRKRKPNIEHHRQAKISGLVLKYLNGSRFVMTESYATTLPISS
jgi:hypothetical protein